MTTSESRLPDDFSDVEEPPRNSGRLRVALEITTAILVLVGIYYLFAPEQEMELPPLKQQDIDPIIREQIDQARQPAKTAAAAEDSVKQQAPVAPPTGEHAALEVAAVDTPHAATGHSAAETLPEGTAARRLIAALRNGDLERTQAELVQQAHSYQQSGDLTDAYLLFFFAARQGDGQAAFDLASLQDPNHFQAGSSLLEAPDAFQAQKWYSIAAKRHIPRATERLQALRSTIQNKADAGDMTARRLLLNWQ